HPARQLQARPSLHPRRPPPDKRHLARHLSQRPLPAVGHVGDWRLEIGDWRLEIGDWRLGQCLPWASRRWVSREEDIRFLKEIGCLGQSGPHPRPSASICGKKSISNLQSPISNLQSPILDFVQKTSKIRLNNTKCQSGHEEAR